VLASDGRAVVLGGLSTRIKRTGKVIDTAFAIILTIAAGKITYFLSWKIVSRRPGPRGARRHNSAEAT